MERECTWSDVMNKFAHWAGRNFELFGIDRLTKSFSLSTRCNFMKQQYVFTIQALQLPVNNNQTMWFFGDIRTLSDYDCIIVS
jgi:hypothetical protein